MWHVSDRYAFTSIVFTVSRTFAPISVVESTVNPCVIAARQVGGAEALLEHLADRGFDCRGFGFKAGGVAQNQRAGEDCAERIGEALAGDVGRGAVDRLIQIDFAADGGRGQHAQRAGDDAGLVGENVAEEILREHHVEVARLVHEVHGHGVDVLVFERYVGELCGDFNHRGAPELRNFKHVGLVHAGEFLAALAGQLEGDAGYAGHFVARVTHGVPGFALGLVPLAGLAEVKAAEQFADKENVGAVDDLRAQRDC